MFRKISSGGLEETFLADKWPTSVVNPATNGTAKKSGKSSVLNGISKRKKDRAHALPTDKASPVKAESVPKKIYSKNMIRLIWFLEAPSVLSNILSLTR